MRTDAWKRASVLQNAAREILKLHTGNTSKIRDKRGYSSIHDWGLHIGVMELHIYYEPSTPPPPALKRKKNELESLHPQNTWHLIQSNMFLKKLLIEAHKFLIH